MKRPARDEKREERIQMEIVVDAYGSEEQIMGWFSYLDEHLRVPFTARCIARHATSPLYVGEEVEVIGMPPGEEEPNCIMKNLTRREETIIVSAHSGHAWVDFLKQGHSVVWTVLFFVMLSFINGRQALYPLRCGMNAGYTWHDRGNCWKDQEIGLVGLYRTFSSFLQIPLHSPPLSAQTKPVQHENLCERPYPYC